MEKHVEVLSERCDIFIEDIPEKSKLGKSYKKVLQNKDNIDNLIEKQFRPVKIVPGTIGSFLFGALQKSYGDVNKECSPLFIEGIKTNKNEITNRFQVWVQNNNIGNNRFTQLVSNNSIDALIYVRNRESSKFTLEEINNMKINGIARIQVLITKRSSHFTIIKMIPITDIVTVKSKSSETVRSNEKNQIVRKFDITDDVYQIITDSANITAIFVVAVILIFIIIIGISGYFDIRNLNRD